MMAVLTLLSVGDALHTRHEAEEVYASAISLMEGGDLEEAIREFDSISFFKDSQSYVTYLQAILFQESGWQKEAARLFESLDDFKDSESRLTSIPSN